MRAVSPSLPAANLHIVRFDVGNNRASTRGGSQPARRAAAFQIVPFERIQTQDVVNSDAIGITTEPLYLLSGLNFAFSQNRK